MTYELTNEQRANLKKLADYLATGKTAMQFGMMIFCASDDVDDNLIDHASDYKCGTVGCAVGHGPYAGIQPKFGEDWLAYSERVFTGDDDDLWMWLFDASWTRVDNTAIGVAKRIYWFLNGENTPGYNATRLIQAGDYDHPYVDMELPQ